MFMKLLHTLHTLCNFVKLIVVLAPLTLLYNVWTGKSFKFTFKYRTVTATVAPDESRIVSDTVVRLKKHFVSTVNTSPKTIIKLGHWLDTLKSSKVTVCNIVKLEYSPI